MSVQMRNKTSGVLERVAGFNDTDAILNGTSRNAIQNRAVYIALQQKIDNTVNNLINYYDKSQVYTKKEVRDLIGAINTLTIEVVSELPTSDISTTTIYFVGPKTGTNNYDEYVYVGGNWVQIGDTTIDLSNYVTSANLTTVLQDYYTKSQTDTLLENYYDKDEADELLDLKQDVLDFDDTPIAGSPNPVTSAGIKTALDNILISGNGGSIIKVHHLAGSAAAGNTVTASKGSYSVSSTFDASGDAIIIGFGEIGNITITCSNGSETGSTVLNIPCFSNYSVNIAYGLDYASWLIAGGIDPSYYESLDEVLEDEEVVRRLMTIHASVDYLASITNADDEVAITVLNNDICAKWINLRDYALDVLYANEYTKSIMDEADKYGYGEWALVGQVPTMTSNTAPYGEVIVSAIYSTGYEAWRVFDGNRNTEWASPREAASAYIGYKFMQAVNVRKVSCLITSGDSASIPTYKVQYSDDGVTWSDTSEDSSFTAVPDEAVMVNIDDGSHLYWRLQGVSRTGLYYYVRELQFYAWQPKGNVPIMTSNTAPYGTAIRKDVYNSTYYEAFKAFNGTFNDPGGTSDYWHSNTTDSWVGYTFTNPICVKRFGIINYPNGSIKDYTIEASNDNFTNEVIVLKTGAFNAVSTVFWQYVDFDNNNYYLSYRIHPTTTYNGNGRQSVVEMQFYGREMKVSVPTMTSDTAPYGEAINLINRHPSYSSYAAYLAMDKNTSTRWSAAASVSSADIGYDFTKPVVIKAFMHTAYGASIPYTAVLQGSDDKTTWINESESYSGNILQQEMEVFDNTNAHRYWRILFTMSGTGMSLYEVNFFGFDYSERDWDIEHPMKYIYDHGVELETIARSGHDSSHSSSYSTVYPDFESNDAMIGQKIDYRFNLFLTDDFIDTTNYKLLRSIADPYNKYGNNSDPNLNGYLGYVTIKNPSAATYFTGYTSMQLNKEYSFNMTNVNGYNYIGIACINATRVATIYELWLE